MEDRRRQSVAFENVVKEMLKYLEHSEELKVAASGSAGERFGGVGKKMSGHNTGNTNAEQKTRHIQKCDRRQAQSAKQSK